MDPDLPEEDDAAPTAPAAEALPRYWSDLTRDRWFFGALALATGAVLVLFTPYLYVLTLATVLVVVTWPIYEWMVRRLHGRRSLASALMVLLLIIGVLVPVGIVLTVFVRQSLVVVQSATFWVGTGGLANWMADLQESASSLGETLGFELDLATTLDGPLQDAVFGALQGASGNLPGLVGATMGVGLDAIIFLFATTSMYVEGPRALQAIRNLVPMDDRYQNKLFAAFRRLANNMVLGTLATGSIQGIIAAIGYAIAGVEQVVFLGILTAIGSLIPVVGTALVWIPATLYVLAVDGWGWAIFVALWSVVLTTSVDNVMKPLFLRGGTQIHPLLIFLGVFSGLQWMGVPGVLVGPVIVVFFVAMYTSYLEDFLPHR